MIGNILDKSKKGKLDECYYIMFSRNYNVSITLLTLISIPFLISFNSIFSQDEGGFFVVPEDEFYDPENYGIDKSVSSLESNNLDEHTMDKENAEQFVDSEDFSDFNFALAGDWGCTKETVKTVDLIQDQNPDLVFSLGDTSYGPNINCWINIVKPIIDKIIAVIGNHDVMSPNLLEEQLKEFELDRPYYSFDYHNIHFLVMDSESSYIPGSDPTFSGIGDTEQYQFVENDLSKASNNPYVKWIIVMSHRQFYSSHCGAHDSCDPIKKWRDTYHPLFERYGVDLLFSGHAHNYERTYPLFYNKINPSQPFIAENGKTDYKSPKGMFQVIVGTGGIDHDLFTNQEPYVVYQQDSSYGFLNIDVSNQENVLIGKYYGNDGDILDEFKIIA
jgi:predicted phosphodiesterase